MVLVCWGIVFGKSYGQSVLYPLLKENNLVKAWDKTLGGSGFDGGTICVKTQDGGLLVVGASNSPISGDKTQANIILGDIWVIKLNSRGIKEWDKIYGVPRGQSIEHLIATPDGGYLLGTTVNGSIGRDKTQVGYGLSDFWILKIDDKGNKQWDKAYGGTLSETLEKLVLCKDGGFLLGGFSYSNVGGLKTEANVDGIDVWLVRIDNIGNMLWEKTIKKASSNYLYDMAESIDGFVLNIHTARGINPPEADFRIISIDNRGNELWERKYVNDYFPSTIGVANNGDIVAVGLNNAIINNNYSTSIQKIDKNGVELWKKILTTEKGYLEPTNLIVTTNGDILCNLSNKIVIDTDTEEVNRIIIAVDVNGNFKWREVVAGKNIKNTNRFSDIYLNILLDQSNQSFYVFGASSGIDNIGLKSEKSKGNYDMWILKLLNPNYSINRITGNIYSDLNTNCQLNLNETGLDDIVVRATPGNYNTFTDSKGNYTLYLDAIGTYTVTPIMPNIKKSMLTSTCATTQTVSFTNLGNIKRDINFGYKVTPCATLTVDISSNRRRRCFRNFTTVKYANEGYAAADNVQLKVIYPQYVVPIRSSVAWTSRQDSVITYNLGRLAAGQTGQIVITDSVICGNESIRGLTQCTKAIISPKSTCLANNPNWDKADLQAFSQCVGAKNVKLSVVNTGEAMRDSTAWRLFLNGVLKQQGRLKLGKGENYSFEILAKGNTVRLEADQTPNHPVGRYALTTIERCGGVVAFSAVLPPPSVQLPINMGASGEEIATSCMPIIDSYDPNDKQVIPAGVGASNIVRDSDELEFQVRFQNTGTDTAYTVIIRDTLSTALDIASLQIGASSHNYTYTVSGKNNPIITWTFNNINLPAQKQDDAGSNGFVKFKIAQMPNNAKGTKIRNKAGIYFDFNSPIITNETNLTVGDLVSDLNNAADLATIFVCNNKPQPTNSQAGTDKITTADSLVLSANVAEKGTGSWKVVQGTGEFANANNPKTTVKKIGLGENIYEWAVSLCNTISASKVKITKVATPKAEITSKGDTLIAEIADSYQWFLNGQALAGATSQIFIAKTNGTYTVEIKKFGITVVSLPFRHTITGIEDDLLQQATSLIPNPAQNTCVLQVRNEYVGEVKVSISNLLGQVVFQAIAEKNTTILDYSLDLQHFTNGIYFVCLQTEKGKVVKKLVKM